MEKKYFYGNEISEYGLKMGYVDYRTLAKCFDAVLNNDIMGELMHHDYYFNIVCGYEYDDKTETYPDIYQYYIVSENAVDILQEADEIVFYNYELDLYIWGVTHYGTSWDYVLTNIKIDW